MEGLETAKSMLDLDFDSFLIRMLRCINEEIDQNIEAGYTNIEIWFDKFNEFSRKLNEDLHTEERYGEAISRSFEDRGFDVLECAITRGGCFRLELIIPVSMRKKTDGNVITQTELAETDPLLQRILKVVYDRIQECVYDEQDCDMISFGCEDPITKRIRNQSRLYNDAIRKTVKTNGFIVEECEVDFDTGEYCIYVAVPPIKTNTPLKPKHVHDVEDAQIYQGVQTTQREKGKTKSRSCWMF